MGYHRIQLVQFLAAVKVHIFAQEVRDFFKSFTFSCRTRLERCSTCSTCFNKPGYKNLTERSWKEHFPSLSIKKWN